jgi:branched-chain amino acid transport system substrate-binding protein
MSVRVLALLCLAALGVASCGATATQARTVRTIRIATDLPASAAFGQSEQDGVQLAISDATRNNELPGFKLELAAADGAQGVQEAIGDASVIGLVGPVTSAEAATDLPQGASAPLAIVSPSDGDVPSGTMPFFRLAVPEAAQGAALADFAHQQGLFLASVFDNAQPDGVALANGFLVEWLHLGGSVIQQFITPAGSASYITGLTAASSSQFIFYGGDAATGGTLLRQEMSTIRSLQQAPLIGGDGLHTAAYAQTIGLGGGATYAATAGPDGSDQAAFHAEYVARFGAGAISTYSAAAYDATMILIHAIGNVVAHGTLTRSAVEAAVRALTYHGVSGTWSFNATGGPASQVVTVYTISQHPKQGDGWQVIGSKQPGS